MGQQQKLPNFETYFPQVSREELDDLRNFLETLQQDLEKRQTKKRKRVSKRPRKPRKKKTVQTDWRIQELPFHF